MTDFSDFLNERLKDEEFRREYEALQPYDYCYECRGYGDDYYYDDDGELVSACSDCWVTMEEYDALD